MVILGVLQINTIQNMNECVIKEAHCNFIGSIAIILLFHCQYCLGHFVILTDLLKQKTVKMELSHRAVIATEPQLGQMHCNPKQI